jgi:hypothetical protein
MRVAEGHEAVRPASTAFTGDTGAAPQSRTAGMASTVVCKVNISFDYKYYIYDLINI